MTGFVALLLSLGVIAATLLMTFGTRIVLRQPDDRRRGWLMIGAGAVTLLNVWLWSTMPGPPA
jgi:hypothetical protein